MKIALIGVGLIGGSFSLAVKRRRLNVKVAGVDRDSKNLRTAKDLGIVDSLETLEEAIEGADLIILAIPVNAAIEVLPNVLNLVNENQLVVDFGSTKEAICKRVDGHPKRSNYLAAHPMAGTEYSGPEAAFATLFEDKVMVLCEADKTGVTQLVMFNELCKNLAMNIVQMTPKEHDLHIAYVSHLSHISSFALSTAVLQKEKDEKHIFAMAGSGFASTVRLAKSSPEMWSPIFQQNKDNVSEALKNYIEELKKFQQALVDNNEQHLKEFMLEANKIRPIIDGIGS